MKRYTLLQSVRFIIVLLIGISSGVEVFAHPDQDKVAIQSLLYQWAHGMQSGDREIVDASLATHFKAYGVTRSEYLGWVQPMPVAFSLAHSQYHKTDMGFQVTPIVCSDDKVSYIYTLDLQKTAEGWKITSIASVLNHSLDLARTIGQPPLPEQFATMPVRVRLYDAKQKAPVYARVHIEDEQGEYWPPRGHQKTIATGFLEKVGGDVQVNGRVFAYVKPGFTVDLPPGRYKIHIAKGMEYTPAVRVFTVAEGQANAFDFQLERWVDMKAKGWFAGDSHTHVISDHNALLEAEAEELSIVSILATKWGRLITDINYITGEPSAVSTPERIIFYNQETRHNFLGHTILHPIRDAIYPITWGGPDEGVEGGGDYPAMAHQADKAHKQGGIVSWAHLGHFTRGELAVDVALQKIDSLDVFTWDDAFSLSKDRDGNAAPSAIQWWYKLLNTGARLSATAGTDKMFNRQITGAVRTYAQLGTETELTYNVWAEAIRAGRTFVTTGPMIALTANGRDIGSVLALEEGEDIILEAVVKAPYERFPWDRFEIVQNGKVIASHSNSERKDSVKLKISLKAQQSAWFAARVYSTKSQPLAEAAEMQRVPVMAHTSPIYVDLPGSQIWSKSAAEFLKTECEKAILWAKTEAHYHSESQRREVVALFEKARQVYDK